jgi:hypothetical protein
MRGLVPVGPVIVGLVTVVLVAVVMGVLAEEAGSLRASFVEAHAPGDHGRRERDEQGGSPGEEPAPHGGILPQDP